MLTVTTTGGRMLFIKNTSSSSKFFITDLWFNWNGGTASHNTCCFGELIFGDTVPDTNIIIGGAGNLNRTSVNTIDLTVLYWDDSAGDGMIGHTPGTTAFYWCYSKAPAYYHTDGSIILGTNDTLSVNLKGEETGEGSINILGYASE